MLRPMRWVVTLAAAVVAFAVSLWVALLMPRDWLPESEELRLGVVLAFATLVSGVVVTAVGRWADDGQPVPSSGQGGQNARASGATGTQEGQMGFLSNNSSGSHNRVDSPGDNIKIKNKNSAAAIVTIGVVTIAAVVAIVLLLVGLLGGEEGAPRSAEVSVSPTAGAWGSTTEVSGRNFRPQEVVTIYVQSAQAAHLGQFRTDSDGSFSGSVRIPNSDGLLSQIQNQLPIAALIGDGKEPDTKAYTYFTIQK